MTKLKIKQESQDPVLNIALDTLNKNKQALVFVNTKRSAEKVAEDISNHFKKLKQREDTELSEQILSALAKPTKQCERLSRCVKYGVGFHHAGLTHKQKDIIEDSFKAGKIKIISCTPTLAAGMDMPAFRTVIRDLKRYGQRGMQNIGVLEYLQMAGRAGRPKYDKEGQAIALAGSEGEKEEIWEKYIDGEPEDIQSKLAVEPVLRTYVLSLIATKFVRTKKELVNFFSKTFWAYQFEDMDKLEIIIDKMLRLLEEWEFIKGKGDDFISASEVRDEKLKATLLGQRVAELYLDPLAAHDIVKGLRRAEKTTLVPFSFLQLVSNTLEMRPLLRVRQKEYDDIVERLTQYDSNLLMSEPSLYETFYDDFLDSVKTALFFNEWIEEKDEEFLLEHYNVRPGETRGKLEIADWLFYCMEEIAKLLKLQKLLKDVSKTRLRIKHGIKEELVPLVKLKEIGRVRARKLFNNGIKDVKGVKNADTSTLAYLLGKKITINIKEQVGQKIRPEEIEIKKGKRKGQMSIDKYNKV
ncbi:helicase-related protein [Nanoarchaeota archaeon]